jgi:hypothetical protein
MESMTASVSAIKNPAQLTIFKSLSRPMVVVRRQSRSLTGAAELVKKYVEASLYISEVAVSVCRNNLANKQLGELAKDHNQDEINLNNHLLNTYKGYLCLNPNAFVLDTSQIYCPPGDAKQIAGQLLQSLEESVYLLEDAYMEAGSLNDTILDALLEQAYSSLMILGTAVYKQYFQSEEKSILSAFTSTNKHSLCTLSRKTNLQTSNESAKIVQDLMIKTAQIHINCENDQFDKLKNKTIDNLSKIYGTSLETTNSFLRKAYGRSSDVSFNKISTYSNPKQIAYEALEKLEESVYLIEDAYIEAGNLENDDLDICLEENYSMLMNLGQFIYSFYFQQTESLKEKPMDQRERNILFSAFRTYLYFSGGIVEATSFYFSSHIQDDMARLLFNKVNEKIANSLVYCTKNITGIANKPSVSAKLTLHNDFDACNQKEFIQDLLDYLSQAYIHLQKCIDIIAQLRDEQLMELHNDCMVAFIALCDYLHHKYIAS